MSLFSKFHAFTANHAQNPKSPDQKEPLLSPKIHQNLTPSLPITPKIPDQKAPLLSPKFHRLHCQSRPKSRPKRATSQPKIPSSPLPISPKISRPKSATSQSKIHQNLTPSLPNSPKIQNLQTKKRHFSV